VGGGFACEIVHGNHHKQPSTTLRTAAHARLNRTHAHTSEVHFEGPFAHQMRRGYFPGAAAHVRMERGGGPGGNRLQDASRGTGGIGTGGMDGLLCRDVDQGPDHASKRNTSNRPGLQPQCYRHIVLAVRDSTANLWGALGLSRREELAFKPLAHPTLSSLVSDYLSGYAQWRHQVLKVRVGLPAPRHAGWTGPVCWRFMSVDLPKRGWGRAAALLDEHGARLGELRSRYEAAALAAATGGAGLGGGAAGAVGLGGSTAAAGAGLTSDRGRAREPPVASETETSGAEAEDDFSGDSAASEDSVVVELRSPRKR